LCTLIAKALHPQLPLIASVAKNVKRRITRSSLWGLLGRPELATEPQKKKPTSFEPVSNAIAIAFSTHLPSVGFQEKLRFLFFPTTISAPGSHTHSKSHRWQRRFLEALVSTFP